MAPKRPADASQAEVSRETKPAKPTARTKETDRGVDSIPVAPGPFTVLPTDFGRYRIEKLLGKGAMGAVYLAHDVQLDRSVALKVARIAAAGSAKLIKRMETEAKAAARVDHPQVCKVYDFGEIDGIRFIAMQYIEGEDLKSYLKRVGRKREPAEAIGWIVRLASALEAAHEEGVIHRDLKPENVMINRKGEPVIMDFGLARSLTSSANAGLTQGMILGTAAYMSPEQAIGKAAGIDHRSDLYALGVMLFEMLTGEWPFTGSAIEVMGKKCVQEAPSPLDFATGLAPQLAAVCHKMIAQKKERRYATCADVIAALEAVDPKVTAAIAMEVERAEAAAVSGLDGPSFDFLDGLPAAAAPSLFSTSMGKKAGLPKKLSSLVPAALAQWWRVQPPKYRWTILGASSVCLALMATPLFFRTGDALAKVEVLEEGVEVTFQKETLTLADGAHQFKVKPGEQALHIKSGNVEFDTDKFTLKRGENPRVTVELVKSEIVTRFGEKEIGRQSLISSNTRDTDQSKRMKGIPADARVFNRHWYKFYNQHVTWSQAKSRCEEMGGHLVILGSISENQFVGSLISDHMGMDAWIGLTDEAKEAKWLDVKGQPISFRNWLYDQPNNDAAVEHYALMTNRFGANWRWCDQPDQALVPHQPGFVCEWDAVAAGMPTSATSKANETGKRGHLGRQNRQFASLFAAIGICGDFAFWAPVPAVRRSLNRFM